MHVPKLKEVLNLKASSRLKKAELISQIFDLLSNEATQERIYLRVFNAAKTPFNQQPFPSKFVKDDIVAIAPDPQLMAATSFKYTKLPFFDEVEVCSSTGEVITISLETF